jgi:hypothetical protein
MKFNIIKCLFLLLFYFIGYNSLSDNLALGMQMSLLPGTLTKFDFSDGRNTETIKLEEENYENLSRLDVTIELRFTK